MLKGLCDVIDGPSVFREGMLLKGKWPLFGAGQLQHIGTGRELYNTQSENVRWATQYSQPANFQTAERYPDARVTDQRESPAAEVNQGWSREDCLVV